MADFKSSYNLSKVSISGSVELTEKQKNTTPTRKMNYLERAGKSFDVD